MKREKMGVGFGVNLLLLLAMAATNILSLYHLSSFPNTPSSSSPNPNLHLTTIPPHLLHQLHTLRSTISHITRLPSSSSSPPPPELLLYSRISPIASSCSDHPDLLHPFMSYTPFSPCPSPSFSLVEPLLLRGCHPLPRRRCFSPSPLPLPSLPSSPTPSKSHLHLPIPQLLAIAGASGAAPIRIGLDIAGGTGTLAAQFKTISNATIVTTTMNLGEACSEAAAMRGVVPLHAPLQQRFPVYDGAMDLVRTGHAVNRWIPVPAMEFLVFDVDRVLKPGGLFWIDHFFCKAGDLESVYGPMIGRLGYKRIKWAVGNKTDFGGVKYGEVYLTALLQKPITTAGMSNIVGKV